MALQPGTIVLDRYIAERLIGEGGMGQVYLGRHHSLGVPVALKVLSATGMPGLVERFEREAMLMAKIRHPNVVAILDYGFLADGSPCIAMEYAEGEGLDLLLERRGALPCVEAVPLLLGVLSGLGAMHEASVLHRDLKPSNILVVSQGRTQDAKLIDFGIALPTGDESQRLTQTGFIVGTPAYMAPEQLLTYPVDARTDLYSAGLILYEMLTGAPPFPGKDISTVMRRLRDPIPAPLPPGRLPPVPRHVRTALLESLSVEADGRPETALDFIAQLEGGAAPQSPEDIALGLATTGILEAPGRDVAAQRAASEPQGRFLVAAKLAPSRLKNPEDRRWLTEAVGTAGRGYSFGAQFWFALQSETVPAAAARSQAEEIGDALRQRYGSTARVEWTAVDQDFVMTGASLTGAAPMPEELAKLMEKLSA